MIKMIKVSRELSIVIFIGLSLLLSRVPIGLFQFTRTKDWTQLVWIAINMVMFGYLCWNIAVVNRVSAQLPCYLYSENLFPAEERSLMVEYLERNMAKSLIFGYALTEQDLVKIYFLLANVIGPILYNSYFR